MGKYKLINMEIIGCKKKLKKILVRKKWTNNKLHKHIVNAGYLVTGPTVTSWVRDPARMRIKEIQAMAAGLGMTFEELFFRVFWEIKKATPREGECCGRCDGINDICIGDVHSENNSIDNQVDEK